MLGGGLAQNLNPFVMEEIGSARSECYVCFLAVEVVNPSMFGNNVVLLQSFIVGSIMIAAFGCARIPPPRISVRSLEF